MTQDQPPSSSGTKPTADQRVKVYVRCRPLPNRNRCVNVADHGGNHVEITSHNGVREFLYDGVFSEKASQSQVYKAVGLPVLEQVLEGFNGCLFAYGPTGSGKTYSLLEDQEGLDEFEGVLPRIVKDLFKRVSKDDKHDWEICAQAVQIYNENLICLLSKQEKLDLHEGKAVGAKWMSAKTSNELLEIFGNARNNIRYAETKLNQHSSRAHAIMRIQLQRRERSDGDKILAETMSSTLTIVDLAGSERQKRSHTKGERFEEAKHINTSLLALGKVVKALVDKTHPPFRDSKLTRILSNTLGGNATTRLLVCVSPGVEHCTETISACEFGKRAMDVVQRAIVNVETTMRTTDEVSGESKWVAVTEELKRKLFREQEARAAAQRETAMVAANVRQISEAYAKREGQIRDEFSTTFQDALQRRNQSIAEATSRALLGAFFSPMTILARTSSSDHSDRDSKDGLGQYSELWMTRKDLWADESCLAMFIRPRNHGMNAFTVSAIRAAPLQHMIPRAPKLSWQAICDSRESVDSDRHASLVGQILAATNSEIAEDRKSAAPHSPGRPSSAIFHHPKSPPEARQAHHDNQYKALCERFNINQEELDCRTRDLAKATEELERLRQESSLDKRELQSVWDDLNRFKAAAKKTLDEKDQENDAFQAKNEDNQQRIKVLSSQLASLQSQLNHQQEVMGRNDHLENEVSRLDEANSVLNSEVENLKVSLQESRDCFEEREQKFRAERDRLMTAAHTENEELTSKLAELELMPQLLQQHKEMLVNQKQSNDEKHSENQELKKEIILLNEKTEKLDHLQHSYKVEMRLNKEELEKEKRDFIASHTEQWRDEEKKLRQNHADEMSKIKQEYDLRREQDRQSTAELSMQLSKINDQNLGKVDELGKANQRFREKDLELSQMKTKHAVIVEEHSKELKLVQQKNFEQYQESLRQTKVAHIKETEELKKEVSTLRERLDNERARGVQERQALQSQIEDYQMQAKVLSSRVNTPSHSRPPSRGVRSSRANEGGSGFGTVGVSPGKITGGPVEPSEASRQQFQSPGQQARKGLRRHSSNGGGSDTGQMILDKIDFALSDVASPAAKSQQ
eukprot:gene391-432_t